MLAAHAYKRPWIATWLLLFACEDSPAPQLDDGGDDGSSPTPALDAGPEAGASGGQAIDANAGTVAEASIEEDASQEVPLPTNVSFETAQRLEPGGPPILQDERTATQVDYYVFTGEAGAFYEITTDWQSFSPDVVVSLYDDEHTLLAQNDNGALWPGNNTDARLLVRLPDASDYYIVVEDPYTPQEFFTGPFSLLYYHLALRQIDDDTEGFVHGTAGEHTEVVFAHDEKTGYSYATVFGELSDETTSFDFDGSENIALIGRAHESGSTGNGSTALGGEVSVIAPDMRTLARIDRTQGQRMFDPPIAEGSHQVSIRPGKTLGDNPFYAVDLILIEDNPGELHGEDNGQLAYAESIDLGGMPGFARQGFVRLTLASPDVDYFSFEANAGERVNVACEGESGGSGVRGLHVEVRDPTDQLLGDGLESPLTNVQLENVMLNATGVFYLRLWSEGQAEGDPVLPWVRCGVIVQP